LQLDELYTCGCGHDHNKLDAKPPKNIQADLVKMAESIWKTKGIPSNINNPVTRYYVDAFWKAVEKGYGEVLSGIEYDTPDFNMLSHLQKNVYQFSAAKNYQQLKSLTQALVNEDGNLRTKKEYFDAAYAINDEHVNTWLNTERDTAIASGQMASKWVDIEADSDTLPLLEFDAIMDERTSAICSSLNGVVRPVEDDFWNIYYPPNHFGCRSTARSHDSGKKVTLVNDIVYPDKMPEMFKVNLAKDRLVFPPKHPYWHGLPEDIKTQGYNLLKEDTKEEDE